jgi:hypothetical protein
MFYSNAAADTSRLRGRPNFYMSTQQPALQAFATFKSLALLPSEWFLLLLLRTLTFEARSRRRPAVV